MHLSSRLEKIYQPPNFPNIFESITNRPSHFFKKNTIIFNDGDPLDKLYCIKEGFVKLFRLSDEGRETTVYLYGPGDVLGIRALTSKDECAKHNAETLTEVKILTISRQEYFTAISKQPEYLVDLLHLFINRLNYTERKLEAFIITDTKTRIALFLVDIINRFCPNPTTPFTLPLPLTHQRIAEFVGSFRETVTNSLHTLEQEKILKSEKSKIIILDLPKLQAYLPTSRV